MDNNNWLICVSTSLDLRLLKLTLGMSRVFFKTMGGKTQIKDSTKYNNTALIQNNPIVRIA